MSEARVTVNGLLLEEFEVTTLRCALSTYMVEMSRKNKLGKDHHGETMRKAYLEHGRSVEQMLVEGANRKGG